MVAGNCPLITSNNTFKWSEVLSEVHGSYIMGRTLISLQLSADEELTPRILRSYSSVPNKRAGWNFDK